MKNKIIFVSAILLTAVLAQPAQSAPYFWATAHGQDIPGFDTGTGVGNIAIDHSYSSSYNDDYQWTLDVHFKGDVRTGQMGANLLSSTTAPGHSRGGPFAVADSQMDDYFHISAGESGLAVGAPVQIRFLSGFSGSVLLEGKPSGGCYVSYQATLSGTSGLLAQLNTDSAVVPKMTSMYPQVDQIVDAGVDQLVTVHIGDTLHMFSYLSMDLNGSGYSTLDPGYVPSGRDDLNFLNGGFARVGFADGFENIEISSDGGATIVPEPATMCLLGLGALGLIRRNKAA
jgi:hypothetical protein